MENVRGHAAEHHCKNNLMLLKMKVKILPHTAYKREGSSSNKNEKFENKGPQYYSMHYQSTLETLKTSLQMFEHSQDVFCHQIIYQMR